MMGKKRILWISGKLARMLLLLTGVSLAAFLLVNLSPADPLQANVGQTALGSMSPEQIENLKVYWGVDEPVTARFLTWGKGVLRGDFGESLLYRRPVVSVLAEKIGNSFWMLLLSWFFSGLTGFALGVFSGVNRGRLSDKSIRAYAVFMSSIPVFCVALLLLMVFGVWLKVLPIGFSVPIGAEAGSVSLGERITHAVLPALTLSVTGIPNIILHTREKMIDIMESDYVLFAKARGESKREIIRRHGLRNVLLPALTLQLASISEVVGGSILVEQVFSYPGLGQAAVTAGLGGDVPLLLGITLVCAGVVFAGNLTADLLYGTADPRMRRGAGI